jgi:tetratricopeptide (TPR) repeat protein
VAKQSVSWQHQVQRDSEVQFRVFVQSLRWLIEQFTNDYGEDWLVRPVYDGNLAGRDFYVQLKGTPNTDQYLRANGDFSYGVDVVRLSQWRRYAFPVIFVLWDTTNGLGYWVHVQPQIESNIANTPNWLTGEDGKRTIRIPSNQRLVQGDGKRLFDVIENEYKYFLKQKEKIEQAQLNEQHNKLQDGLKSVEENTLEAAKVSPLPPKIEQQIALAKLEAAILANPADASKWLEKAMICYDLLDIDKALSAINQAWQLGLRNNEATLVRGSILVEFTIAHEGQPKAFLYEAIQLFETLRNKADDFLLDYNIGNAYVALLEHGIAIEHFDKALSRNSDIPHAAQVWKNRGTSFFHLGDHDEEIKSYKKALELNPRLWEAYSSWGVTELHLGNYENAKQLFKKSLHLVEDRTAVWISQIYSLAYALCNTDEIIEAYRYVNKLLQIVPDHENAINLKIFILSRLWRFDSIYVPTALSFFKNLFLNSPNDTTVQNELYLLQETVTTYKFPFPKVDEDEKLDLLTPLELFKYAIFLRDEGEIFDARKCLQIAYAKSKDHAIVHSLAQLNVQIGSYHDALPLFMVLLMENPNSIPILGEIADAYHFLQNYRECVRYAAKAILLNARDIDYWRNLFFALGQLKISHILPNFIPFLQSLEANMEFSETEMELYTTLLLDYLYDAFGEEFIDSIVPPPLS